MPLTLIVNIALATVTGHMNEVHVVFLKTVENFPELTTPLIRIKWRKQQLRFYEQNVFSVELEIS